MCHLSGDGHSNVHISKQTYTSAALFSVQYLGVTVVPEDLLDRAIALYSVHQAIDDRLTSFARVYCKMFLSGMGIR